MQDNTLISAAAVTQSHYSPHSVICLPLTVTPNQQQTTIKSQPIQQPFVYEVNCPISCAGVGIGCYNHDPSQKPLEAYEFRTTSQRTVSVTVNQDILCLINNNKPQNKDKKKTDNTKTWGIGLRVKQKGNLAVLNPYVAGNSPLSLYVIFYVNQTLEAFATPPNKPTDIYGKFSTQHIEDCTKVTVGRRIVYYKKNLLCYNNLFELPTERSSLVTLSNPADHTKQYRGTIEQLKKEINEELAYWLHQLQLTSDTFTGKSDQGTYPQHNLDQIYIALGMALNLDEQLRCKLLHSQAASLYRELYPNHLRLYTAIYRLSSYVNYGNTKFNVAQLAEHGFYNTADGLQKLSHYECPHAHISNIEEGHFKNEQDIVRLQLPFLRSVNGLPYPNVPLKVSLLNHPAGTHSTSESNIKQICSQGRYLGVISDDKVFTMWSTELMLLKLITIDIKKKNQSEITKTETKDIRVELALAESEEGKDTGTGDRKEKDKEPAKVVEPDADMLQQLINMGFPMNLSKNALIKTENESIQVAIDMIEQLKIEEQKKSKKTKEENKLKIKAEWYCSFCTLKNISPNESCEICANPAPEDAYINEQQIRKQEQERLRKQQQARKKQKQEQQRKAKQEQEDRKKKQLQSETRKIQEEIERLEKFISEAQFKDFKIIYNPENALQPFHMIFLLQNAGKAFVRVFEVGLNPNYSAKFYRVEAENQFISNFNQSIYTSIDQLIQQARWSVECGRKLFEPVEGDWQVTNTSDMSFEKSYAHIVIRGKSSFSLQSSTDNKIFITIETVKEDKKNEMSLHINKILDVQQKWSNRHEEHSFEQPFNNQLRLAEHGNQLLPKGTCYFEMQILQHLNKGVYKLNLGNVPLEENQSKTYSKQFGTEKSILNNFIPLTLENFEGSCCNEKHIPSTLFMPGVTYVSNYSQANFTFRALCDERILVESVTIVSELKAVNLGHPICSGLIFTADQAGWFKISKSKFAGMKKSEYEKWLSQRKNGEQIAFWEPVGAFELKQTEKSVEFELDHKRPARYIFFLPTSLKKSIKKFEQSEICMDFFGVKGRVIGREIKHPASSASHINNQGLVDLSIDIVAIDDQGKEFSIPKNQISIHQKSQINGIDFISNVSAQALNHTPVSVTTYISIRVKNKDNVLAVRCNSDSIKSLRVVRHEQQALTHPTETILHLQEEKDTKLISNLLEQLSINPFLAEELAQKIDLEAFLSHYVLSEKDHIYEIEVFLKTLETQKGFKEKLLSVILNILKGINNKDVQVTPQGLKCLFGLLYQTYSVGKEQTAAATIQIWDITSNFVKKTRNPSYRILRNKYAIQELVLEKKLFSEYYHNLIDNKPATSPETQAKTTQNAGTQAPKTTGTAPPSAPLTSTPPNTATASTGTQTVVAIPAPLPAPVVNNEIGRVIVEQPLHLNMNVFTYPGASISYVTLQQPTSVQSIDLYFDRASSQMSKFKLRLRVYEARNDEGTLQARLIYHQCFDEDLSVQMINYGHSTQSQIYKSNSNILTLQNLNTTTQHLIIEADFSFLTLRMTKKSKDLAQQVNIVPIVKGEKALEPINITHGFVSRHNEQFHKLFKSPEDGKASTEHHSDKMPLLKSIPLESSTHYAVYLPQQRQYPSKESCNELVGEISSNIMNEELVRAKCATVNFKGCYGEKGLDFSYTFLILLNKFARQCLLDQLNSPSIGDILINLYQTFVVYEIGPISEHILSLIVELLEKLPKLESNRFIARIVEIYLSDSERLKKLTLTQEYQIKHVLATLKRVKQLPFAQLLQMLQPKSTKLQLTNILILLKDCLKKPILQRQVYDFSTNTLVEEMMLGQILDRLFDTSLLILSNIGTSSIGSSFQNNLLSISIDTVLEFFDNLTVHHSDQVKPIIDSFLNKYSKEDLWRLIFITLKLKDEMLESRINSLIKHLISNVNETFSRNINRMIYEIINKSEHSLYMQINGHISDQIWMRHLQTVLEFLIKSQKEASKVFLDIETSESLLKLPLTPALWSLALSILPRDERILEPLIQHLTPELYSVLSYEIMAFCEPLANIKLVKSQQLNWLELVRKLKLEGKTLFELFVEELKKSNFGGRQALTMAHEHVVLQLQTTDDLLDLLLKETAPFAKSPKDSTVREMIQWYMLNRSTEAGQSPATELLKSISDNLLKLFGRFHENEQLVKCALAQLLNIKKETEVIETLCKEKVLNNYTSISLNQRICECFEQLIEVWMTNDNLAHYFALNIKGFDYIFNLIGVEQQQNLLQIRGASLEESLRPQQQQEEDAFLESLDLIASDRKKPETKAQNVNSVGVTDLKEEQMATKVKMIKLPGQTATVSTDDWSSYKKGTKNKLFLVHMVPPFYTQYPLIVELDKLCEVKSIRLGFMASETNFSDKLAIVPSSVVVDGGIDAEHLEPLGELTILNDEGYTTNSIKVFVKNFQMIRSSQSIEQSIKSLANSKIKVLKFTIRRPVVSFIEGMSVLTGKSYKSLAFSLSFLSISGYDVAKMPTGIEKRCRQMSKRTSLVVLYKLFNESFIGTINKLANEPDYVSRIKNNFREISQLMDQYGDLVSSINYILGANNEQLGDWMIEYFLKNGSKESHARLISQILLSNASKIYPRLQTAQASILKALDDISALGSAPQAIMKLNQLFPFLENYCTSLDASISTTGCSTVALQLQCHRRDIDNILHIYDSNHSVSSSTTLIKLLVTLIYIRQPYRLTEDLLEYTLNKIWLNCTEEKLHFFDLLSAMVVNRRSVLWLEQQNNQRVSDLINSTYASIDQNKLKLAKAQISLITQISRHLHAYLKELNCHINLYNRLKNITFSNNEILNCLVKIIKNVVLNNPGSESDIAEMLVRDLDLLAKRKDAILQMFYVDVLGIEREVYVAMKGLSTLPKQDFAIPSVLLSKSHQVELMKKISIKAKFSLLLNITQEADTSIRTKVVKIVHNTPFLVVIKAVSSEDTSKTCVCGAYCVTEPTYEEGEVVIPNGPGNFLFYFTDNKTIFLDCNETASSERFGAYPTEDDFYLMFYHGGTEKIKISFDSTNETQITFCEDSNSYVFQSCEFWDLKQLQNNSSMALTLGKQATPPINYYRPQPVYIVPYHITAEKLLRVLGVNTKLLVQGKEIEKDKVIGQYEELTQDFIVDMEVNLTNCSTFTPQKGYMPQMLIYKEFQRQHGVSRLIEIGVESIKTWKKAEAKKKWQQFLEELQLFVHIPNFFGLFIKNLDCFSLLFEVVAGLPDDGSNSTKNWEQQEAKATRFIYQILADIFKLDKSPQLRSIQLNEGFIEVVLDKLAFISKETVRRFEPKAVEPEPASKENEPTTQGEATKESPATPATPALKEQSKNKKKKGIGYGVDSNPASKWSAAEYIEYRKQISEEILRIITILVNFLDSPEPSKDSKLSKILQESCLLPLLESSLRSGSILDISKEPILFKHYLELIRTLAKNPSTIDCLLPISSDYKPQQTESISSLLGKLNQTADIFISCMKTNKEDASNKTAEDIGHDIKNTHAEVKSAIDKVKQTPAECEIRELLKLPLAEAYRKMLGPLRFDNISMKEGNNYKHHWLSLITEATPPAAKVLRLSQELADLSSSLPCEHTNSIFVRCDKERVDIIRIMIMGSKDTPYSNGAFTFDVFCEDVYPNSPPKMAITTTGSGKIRFNPNLYACGKVCLSLLGTWRGSANENWDAKLSTLLQLFISTQGITMSEDIYYNEPGFEGEQGTEEGDKKNEAYANIVRLGNVRHAMIQQIKNPPKGFETIIHRHFYLKRQEIMDECNKWIKLAETREASYTGLVSDHNSSWCTELKASKTKYKELLVAAVNELEVLLNKLQEPKVAEQNIRDVKIKKPAKVVAAASQQATEQIDMKYDTLTEEKELNYQDEKVKDRWSRYIGAMGIEAVKKQSESQVLLVGLGAMGLEISKNLVLSGLKRITIVDNEKIRSHRQHFFMSDMPGEYRHKCIFKLKELNHYVKVDHAEAVPANIDSYNIIIDTRSGILPETTRLAEECSKLNKKFILAQTRGVYGRVFNDFGQDFTINDTNGEQPVEVMIRSITNEESAVVTLLEGSKHPYEDGEYVVIDLVEGMNVEGQATEFVQTEQQKFYDEMTGSTSQAKSQKSINGRVFKITTINANSFRIGDTRSLSKYIRNGIARNIKLPKKINFKPFRECFKNPKELPFDNNLQIYDFEKMSTNSIVSVCFDILSEYVIKHKKLPTNWSDEDANQFVELAQEKIKLLAGSQEQVYQFSKFAYEFALTADSELPVIGAYLGGMVAQQAIKALTNKYYPIQQLFTLHFKELLPELPAKEELHKFHIKETDDFYNTKVVLGEAVAQQLEKSNVFVIGAGAIGCELLKNFAMFNLCVQGTLTVTDPDHIETSNLNRQFLFRQKHLRKPKSATAAAAITQMNPLMKGHVVSKLDKVCDATENTYSDKFYRQQNVVANALDNVQARLYVDRRCVLNKKPLLESGTLGPKGHVQVIIPYVTESYGSQNDPVEENQIPHCTLKLFPEDTLHCIQWSRDIFGKVFTLRPKGLKKLIEEVKQTGIVPTSDETSMQSLKMAKRAPSNFDDCIAHAVKKFYKYFRNDIRQLLHTYPLDAKTKDGEPFWKLPKRPPQEIKQLDETDDLHATFISSYAVNRAKIFGIPYPKDFRTPQGKKTIMQTAMKIKVPEYAISEEKSKKIERMNQDKNQLQEKVVQQQQPIMEEVTEQKVIAKNELPKEVMQMTIVAEEFEKDNDSNGHIDLIYSMANLRSRNYSLTPYTWIQTKLKAGRIMPALATTTTVISAFQSIQLIQVIRRSKLVRNTFVNLAVPIIQISQPGPVVSTTIGNTKISVWDIWELKASTLREVFEQLKLKYEVEPVDALIGGEPVYLNALYKDKQSESNQVLDKKLVDLLQLDKDDEFVDFTISFRDLKSGLQIEKVPLVRVIIST